MERKQNPPASRDVLRAVLTARDFRHNETHALLLCLYQGLVTELVDQDVLNPALLAQRLGRYEASIAAKPHGATAQDMLKHVLRWLHSIDPALPPPHPSRWEAPETSQD